MRNDRNVRKNSNGLKVLQGACALVIWSGLGVSTGSTQDAGAEPARAAAAKPAAAGKPAAAAPKGKPYFIEFRARSAHNYGHTFVVHGRVGQKITAKDVVGLHPKGDSAVPWMIGHILPVVSETGWSDGDIGYNDAYITARYRIFLSEAEYKPLAAYLRGRQANSPVWHAALYNCNKFVGDIANHMGLSAPFHWVMPKDFVNGIKERNGGRQELSPSSDGERAVRTAAPAQNNARPKPATAANDGQPKPAAAGEARAQTTAAQTSARRKPAAAARPAAPVAAAPAEPTVYPSYAAAQ